MDLYRPSRPQTPQGTLVNVGRVVAIISVIIAVAITKPILGEVDQAFQYIQDFTGFVTPGICVIFLLGLFWERTTSTAAMVAALATVVMAVVFKLTLPDYPFLHRVGWCFVAGMVLAVAISLATPRRESAMRVDIKNVDFRTGGGFNVAALLIVAIVACLYAMWW
jgi:SSS family solute:Na+ symporter